MEGGLFEQAVTEIVEAENFSNIKGEENRTEGLKVSLL